MRREAILRSELGDMEARHQQERRKKDAEMAAEREVSESAKAREEAMKLQVVSLEEKLGDVEADAKKETERVKEEIEKIKGLKREGDEASTLREEGLLADLDVVRRERDSVRGELEMLRGGGEREKGAVDGLRRELEREREEKEGAKRELERERNAAEDSRRGWESAKRALLASEEGIAALERVKVGLEERLAAADAAKVEAQNKCRAMEQQSRGAVDEVCLSFSLSLSLPTEFRARHRFLYL